MLFWSLTQCHFITAYMRSVEMVNIKSKALMYKIVLPHGNMMVMLQNLRAFFGL